MPNTGDSVKMVSKLQNRQFAFLKCEFCWKDKELDDAWWCRECFKILCSRCELLQHKLLNHPPIQSWNSKAAVRDCWKVLEKMINEKHLSSQKEEEEVRQSLLDY